MKEIDLITRNITRNSK